MMDIHTAIEESYKKGYQKGYEDGKGVSRKGHWIIHSVGHGDNATNLVECSECHVCGSPWWKVCPVCEARMEPIPMDDSFPEAKTINVKNVNREVKSYGE